MDTAIHQVVHNLEWNMKQKKLTLAAFIDIEDAFNKLPSGAVNVALRKFNPDRILIRWVMDMFWNRLLTVELLGLNIRQGVFAGRSPVLWNITVDDLLTKLNGTDSPTT